MNRQMKRYAIAALLGALISLIGFGFGYHAGFIDGDRLARTDRAETINQCYDRTATKVQLYGCYASN